MTPHQMVAWALVIASSAFGTAILGRLLLAHPAHRNSRMTPPVCPTPPDDSEALRLLERVSALFPDIDIPMLKKQVHP